MQIDYLKEIKRQVTVKDVADRYGIETNVKGFAKCLFHSEKTASMKIYPDSRGFYCFGCGVGGDSIDFTAKLYNISTYESAKKLNSDFGLGLPLEGQRLSYQEQQRLQRKLFEERKKRKEAEKERQKMFENWLHCYCVWIELDKIKRYFKPTTADEEPHPLWLMAIKNIDRAESELREVETRRWIKDNGK